MTLPAAQAQALQPKAVLGKGDSSAGLETPSEGLEKAGNP